MATLKELEAAGIDTAGIRTNGEYGIKHINLLMLVVLFLKITLQIRQVQQGLY